MNITYNLPIFAFLRGIIIVIVSRFTSSVLQNITQYHRSANHNHNTDNNDTTTSSAGSATSSDGPLFVDFDLGPREALNEATAGTVVVQCSVKLV